MEMETETMEEVELKNFIFHFRKIPDWLRESPIAFHCLAEFGRRASHIERDISINGENVHLKPKEFITGRKTTAKDLGISEGLFRGAYKKLVKNACIQTIKVTSRYTISLYCDDKAFFVYTESNLPAEEPPVSPPPNQQPTIKNTVDTVKTEEDIKSRFETSPLKSLESPPYKDKPLTDVIEKIRAQHSFLRDKKGVEK